MRYTQLRLRFIQSPGSYSLNVTLDHMGKWKAEFKIWMAEPQATCPGTISKLFQIACMWPMLSWIKIFKILSIAEICLKMLVHPTRMDSNQQTQSVNPKICSMSNSFPLPLSLPHSRTLLLIYSDTGRKLREEIVQKNRRFSISTEPNVKKKTIRNASVQVGHWVYCHKSYSQYISSNGWINLLENGQANESKFCNPWICFRMLIAEPVPEINANVPFVYIETTPIRRPMSELGYTQTRNQLEFQVLNYVFLLVKYY